jgi:hypothetical protein
MGFVGRALVVVGAVLAGATLTTGPAHASPDAAAIGPSITVTTPDLLRIDRQTAINNAVIVRGVDSLTRVRVNWGDGARTDRVRGRCAPRTARAHPKRCTVSISHEYVARGTFTITAVAGPSHQSKLVTIAPAPVRWSPPTGWIQPAGWSLLFGKATYYPCQTVNWYLDRTAQPADGGQLSTDIRAGLALLAEQTGLTFVELGSPASADLSFGWADIGGAAGSGGGRPGHGEVTFDTGHWWPRDAWPGFGIVTQADGSYALGHGWLVVHETMHALGLGHVDDPTSMMNPTAGATALSAADLDGLHTLYLNNTCPVG